VEYVTLAGIGLLMGLFGGALGIGGSIVMIPAMVLAFGENQHLYQGCAMICNFFVAASSLMVHKKQNLLTGDVLKWLIPAATIGIIIGVAVSNCALFAAENSYLLARVFGVFLIYVAGYNFSRFFAKTSFAALERQNAAAIRRPWFLSLPIGLVTGVGAGLLGMGAGTISTPLQQLLLKMPLRKAMSNSAATITSIALIGAVYKNLTLARHGIWIGDSLRMAAVIIPTAVLGGFFGGHLMHKLPKNIVRSAFILTALLAAVKLLTVKP